MKRFIVYLVFMFLLLVNVEGIAYANTEINQSPYTNVPLDKEWIITFSESKQLEERVEVYIEDAKQEEIEINVVVENNKLKITPMTPYEQGSVYKLYIKNKQHPQQFKEQVVTFHTMEQVIDDPIVLQRMNEIEQRYEQLQPVYTGTLYEELPSSKPPYKLGKLKDQAVQDGVNATNFVRYVAYLPDNVEIHPAFMEQAQATALINGANNGNSHYPKQPPSMENALYELGYKGAGSSNLWISYDSLADTVVKGYMADDQTYNINNVGHRRWIISPTLKYVGFGNSPKANGESDLTAMKVFDNSIERSDFSDFDYVAWPAQVAMPISHFAKDGSWSVTLNNKRFDNEKIDDIELTLVRLNDQKTWNFKNYKGLESDGQFHISTDSYGYVPFTITFKPAKTPLTETEKQRMTAKLNTLGVEVGKEYKSRLIKSLIESGEMPEEEGQMLLESLEKVIYPTSDEYRAGDRYRVTISNLYKLTGEKTEIEFETTFFNLKN